jgi:ABC-type amino acid transport substrate-binding protein
MIQVKFLFFAVLSLLASSSVSALTLRTAAQDFPPKYFIQNNKMRGYSVDIMSALHRAHPEISFTGYDEFRTVPRIESDLEAGRLDIFVGAFKTSSRLARFSFVEIPLYTLRYVMVVRAKDNIHVTSFEEIRKLGKGNIILTLFGSGLLDFLKKQDGLEIDSSALTVAANLRKLKNGRGRFFFITDLGLSESIDREHLKGELRILPATFGQESQYIMVSKKLASEPFEKLKSALSSIKTSGELEKVFMGYQK